MTRAVLLALGMAVTILTPVQSQERRPAVDPAKASDIIRGRAVAFGGERDVRNIPCIQCHGADGTGNSSGAFPRLAPQSEWYLYKTLQDYASGIRQNEIMGPIAQTLSEQDMRDVASYYGSIRNAAASPQPHADAQLLQVGGAISAAGIPEQGVPACAGCHGRNATGGQLIYPSLAGQYAPYTEYQLRLWKEGRRDGDPMNVMELIAKAMTDQQIRAVSLYLASLAPGYNVQETSPTPSSPSAASGTATGVQPPYLPQGEETPGAGQGGLSDQTNSSR